MAIEFGKGITLAGGFDLGAKAPLDSRDTVATLADRDAHVTGNRAYEGMLVYVEENKVTYQYVADEEGNLSWKEFGFNLNDFQTQVIDNLESDDATKALSAKQGKALKALIDAEAEAARDAEEANADAIADLDAKVGDIPTDEEGNAVADTVVAYIDQKVAAEETRAKAAEEANADAIKAIADDYLVEADKTELQGNIDTVSGKVTTLIGEDVDKSVRTIANEELAKQLIAEGAKESLDTLAEIAAWIQEHPEDASAMNKAIEDLEALVGELPAEIEATTIVGYIAEVVAAEKARAEKAETDLDERLQVVEAKFEGDESVDNKIATAKQEAIDAAKGYADGLDKAMDARMDAVEADKHTHANKDELDLIVAGDKAKWDAAEEKAHEHANKALLDTYTQTEADLADAVAKKHAHENADVLAGITADKVAAWDAAEQNAKTHAETKVNELANGTVAEHTTEINALDERVDDLEAKFTGENSVESKITKALEDAKKYTDDEVKELADGAVAGNTAAIAKLNGDATTEGSVAKAVADAKAAIDADVDAVEKKADKNAEDIAAINDETDGILAQAKKHADDLNTAMDERMDVVEGKAHTHDNKAELDKFVDGDKAKLDDAYAKAHVHENATVLDGITAEKVAAWDVAEKNAKDYVDGLNETMAGRMDDAEGAIEAIETSLAEGGTTANAIKAAHDAADKAQGEVDALEEVVATKAAQADLEAEAKARDDADKAIEAKIGTVAENKTVVGMIGDVQGEVDALEQAHATDKKALEDADAAMAERITALESVTHEEITLEEIQSLFNKTEA